MILITCMGIIFFFNCPETSSSYLWDVLTSNVIYTSYLSLMRLCLMHKYAFISEYPPNFPFMIV